MITIDYKGRIFKYRGQNISFGEWEYGYFWLDGFTGNCYIKDEIGVDHHVIPETVSELVYSSKEGKEVYEGDYVIVDTQSQKNGIYLIEWDAERFIYKAISPYYSLNFWEIGYPEPIGNRWDDKLEVLYSDYCDKYKPIKVVKDLNHEAKYKCPKCKTTFIGREKVFQIRDYEEIGVICPKCNTFLADFYGEARKGDSKE